MCVPGTKDCRSRSFRSRTYGTEHPSGSGQKWGVQRHCESGNGTGFAGRNGVRDALLPAYQSAKVGLPNKQFILPHQRLVFVVWFNQLSSGVPVLFFHENHQCVEGDWPLLLLRAWRRGSTRLRVLTAHWSEPFRQEKGSICRKDDRWRSYVGRSKVQKVPKQVRKCCFYTVLNTKICLWQLIG